jgi:predicted secreted protein
MDRSKKVIFLSHCILNQNTVVYPLARAKGVYRQIIEAIMDAGIGIHQLPCPEYKYLGLKRKPMDKQEYNTPEFRKIGKDISIEAIKIMQEYIDNDYVIVGLIGINHSPACSIRDERGILMEELLTACKQAGIDLKTMDVSGEYLDGKDNVMDMLEVKNFIG